MKKLCQNSYGKYGLSWAIADLAAFSLELNEMLLL